MCHLTLSALSIRAPLQTLKSRSTNPTIHPPTNHTQSAVSSLARHGQKQLQQLQADAITFHMHMYVTTRISFE